MKLLLDQNISYRLVKSLEPLFPGTQQVKRLNLENTSDPTIWDYAKREGFAIVTFDSDFYDLSLLRGHPPKLIWIKSGNTTSERLLLIIQTKAEQINAFLTDTDLSCLEIVD